MNKILDYKIITGRTPKAVEKAVLDLMTSSEGNTTWQPNGPLIGLTVHVEQVYRGTQTIHKNDYSQSMILVTGS